jgi:hypothetical protein
MTLKERVESFSELGRILRDALDGNEAGITTGLNAVINDQQFKNQWFTPENVRMAISAIAGELTSENLEKWTGLYQIPDQVTIPVNVGVVMAGNIPLVGFHDFLSVLVTGNKLIAKKSTKDPDLITFVSDLLIHINPGFRDKIAFADGTLEGFDAIIATGSDNSSRYFEYYFGKYPHIIRKNRTSIAIIEGNETAAELNLLGNDIFSYFGLGCRSVSKIYIPGGYDIAGMVSNWSAFAKIINHNKYANNYDYNKAVFIVSKEPFIDSGFLLLKENKGLSSPVAVLYFEYYDSLAEAVKKIENAKDKIQCIISRNYTPFGHSQSPHLWDYADGIDTVEFLLKKNQAVIL